mgnify:CR=1 FL=1
MCCELSLCPLCSSSSGLWTSAAGPSPQTPCPVRAVSLPLGESCLGPRCQAKARAEVQEKLLAAESRANTNRNALEEARTLLDTTDRARRTLEQELAEERAKEEAEKAANAAQAEADAAKKAVSADAKREKELRRLKLKEVIEREASAETEADRTGDERTTNRRLRQRLYLLLQINGRWQFPQATAYLSSFPHG